MSTLKTLAKGSAWLLIAAIFVKFSGFLYTILLARTLTPEQIGQFFLVLSIIGIIAIFSDFGLGNNAIARFVPYYTGKKKFNYVRKIFKISFSVNIILGIFYLLLTLFLANSISNFFHDPTLIPLFYIMAFYFLAINLYGFTSGFLQSMILMKFVSHMQNLQAIFKLLLTAILLFFIGFSTESMALGFLFSFLFVGMIGFYWTIKSYKNLPISNEIVKTSSILKEMIPFGIIVTILSSMSTIMGYTDRIMIGYFFPEKEGEEMIGIYIIAITLSSLITIFTSIIGTTFYPLISKIYGSGNIKEMQEISKTFIRWIFLINIPLLLIILIFPSQILTYIYGQDYAMGYISLMLYGFGLFIYTFSYVTQYILAAKNRLDITRKILFIGLIVNVILNFLFIPQWNINGAALASCISFIIMTYLFLKQSNITNVKFPKDVHKYVIAGILAGSVLYLLATFFNIDEILIKIVSQKVITTDTFSEILLKFLKVSILGIFVLITFALYLLFLIKFKAFYKEDVEILSGAMRKVKVPKRYISHVEKILLRK